LLRDKGFSYREIAQWLSEHGVHADHNAVYRVYHNNISDYDSYLEEQRENQEASDEAERNRL
jgi:transposase-like protein